MYRPLIFKSNSQIEFNHGYEHKYDDETRKLKCATQKNRLHSVSHIHTPESNLSREHVGLAQNGQQQEHSSFANANYWSKLSNSSCKFAEQKKCKLIITKK